MFASSLFPSAARSFFTALAALCLMACSSRATVILDDTFADGSRTNQNLPTDAAWFVSTPSSWKTAMNALTETNSTSAIMAVTYFGANTNAPVSLAVGDTLTVTMNFTFNNVAGQNGSSGFRIGVYDFADSSNSPKWATSDLSGSGVLGNGVKGYSLFQNFGVTFNSASPMDIRSRTNLTSTTLLGTSGDHESLVTGPGSIANFPGFTNTGQYALTFVLFRTNATDMFVSATWQNLSGGATLTTAALDANAATFNFDGIGFRPSTAASSATNITFNEVRVDLTSTGAGVPPAISLDPHDVTAYTNQTAFFSVVSDGTAPLSYQWYFNTNTPVGGATNSALTLTNLQTTNSGGYSVIVTNSFGSDTSAVAQLTVTVPVAPTITSQPQNATVLPGAGTNFTVSANGSTPLSYQWYFNTNTAIVGANNYPCSIRPTPTVRRNSNYG